jgi:hypothetical protein
VLGVMALGETVLLGFAVAVIRRLTRRRRDPVCAALVAELVRPDHRAIDERRLHLPLSPCRSSTYRRPSRRLLTRTGNVHPGTRILRARRCGACRYETRSAPRRKPRPMRWGPPSSRRRR